MAMEMVFKEGLFFRPTDYERMSSKAMECLNTPRVMCLPDH